MIADRAKAMMAAGGDFPELEARGAYSGEWKSLPERRITFHFYTERDDEFLDFGSFCMKCGGRPLVEGALDFYPWHLLGVAAFFYTVDKKGGAEFLFYDPGCWCDVVYLEPVAGTGKMVLTVRKNRDHDNPEENVCPLKFRCLVDREMFLHNFWKALSKKVSDRSLEKWMVLRVNNVFDKGLDRGEKLAQVRKAEETAAAWSIMKMSMASGKFMKKIMRTWMRWQLCSGRSISSGRIPGCLGSLCRRGSWRSL